MSSRRAAILIPLFLVVIAGGIRLINLGFPGRIVFDETYYVNDARSMLNTGGVEGEFVVHPPVGKWFIALGITLFGDNPTGWRIGGVVAGTLVVLLTYLMAARLLSWRGAAALAGLMAALDGLLYVQARTAMLDAYLGLFVALGAWLLLVDYERSHLGEARGDVQPRRDHELPIPAGGSVDEPPPGAGPGTDLEAPTDSAVAVAPAPEELPAPDEPLSELPVRTHGYRLLAGLAFGLAISTKWSAATALLVAGVLSLVWELAWRRRLTGRLFVGLRRLAASLAVAFVLIPAGTYLVSYIPWLINYAYTTEGKQQCSEGGQPITPCYVSIPGRFAGLWRFQKSVAEFHENLEAEHPYRAQAWTWLIMKRPIVYYWEACPEERAKGIATKNDETGQMEVPPPCVVQEHNAGEIIALGNPALWYAALAALIPLAFGAFRRDRRAWFILAFWGGQYIPWLLIPRPAFLFYMVPVVPFLALAVGYAVVWIDEFVERRALARDKPLPARRFTPGIVTGAVLGLAVVGLFIYFYPLYSGMELPFSVVRQRWWFSSWI